MRCNNKQHDGEQQSSLACSCFIQLFVRFQNIPSHCFLHLTSINYLLFSKLTPISATEDMDETQFTHVIKCPPNHTLLSRVHWLICQVNELTKCL